LDPFIAFDWGPFASFLGPFGASVLDPSRSYLGLIDPSFIIERWGPCLPYPYHPSEAVQQAFLIILAKVILAQLVAIVALEIVLEVVILLQQVVVDRSYLI